MDHLPLSDIAMLLSTVNTMLRDGEFDSLDELCEHFGITRSELDAKMGEGGFEFSEQQNKYW